MKPVPAPALSDEEELLGLGAAIYERELVC